MSESKLTIQKSSSDKKSKYNKERIQDTLLLRKRKDFKPWQPKSSYSRKRNIPLGTRLKGDIPRRLDRPYSQIDLSDNPYNHYDEFEQKLELQTNYVKDRVRSANIIWDTISKSSINNSVVTREIIPGNKPKARLKKEQTKVNKTPQKQNENKVTKKNKSVSKKSTKPKLLWSQSYEQAKRMKLATQKSS